MYKNLIPCLLALITCISCQRELGEVPSVDPLPELPDTTVIQPDPPGIVPQDNQVQTSVQGKVTGADGEPLSNVTVTAGGKTALTNEYGVFRIKDIVVPEHYTFVKAEKNGYFTGSRTIISQQQGMGFVKIKMLPRELKATFNSNSGATITINNTSNVTILSDAVTTSTGETYSGNVKVYATEINPEAADFNEIMPGDLRAIAADSQYTALKSYGMLTITLESETGQPLQLAPGKPGIIKMKVPQSLVSSAPAHIPLWHFSEVDGIWREEGQATLANGWYSGSVSHFSTWNYDVPSNFVFVSLTVKGLKSARMPYSRVQITDTQTGVTSDLYTDSLGYLRTWVPKNVPLTVKVLSDCGEELSAQNVNALNQDKDLGSIYVYPSTKTANISGEVLDCNDQPLSDVNALMIFRGLYYNTEVVDGRFNFSVSTCENSGNTAVVYVVDKNNYYITEYAPVQVNAQSYDLGSVKVCNEEVDELATQRIMFNLGTDSIDRPGLSAIHTYSGFENGDSLTRINCVHALYDVGAFNINIYFRDSSVHTSTIYNPSNIELYLETYTPVEPMIVNVEEYGAIGEDVFLTFTGRYKKVSTGEIVPLSGQLRTKRR